MHYTVTCLTGFLIFVNSLDVLLLFKGPELFSKWVGESERAVRELFNKARQNAPCVLFFDEIDAIAVDRQHSSESSSGVENRVLSQMLNEMDGISLAKQVIVIGATNRPDIIDSALMRPGRLDRIIYVPLPDEGARKTIFEVNLKKLKIYWSEEPQLWESSDACGELTAIADTATLAKWLGRHSHGLSGAEISMVCREAAMTAVRATILRYGDKFESVEYNPDTFKGISPQSFRDALRSTKPRITPDLVEFYENFSRKK